MTFDDGPQAGNTEQILAILAQNNVKATFFQVGANLAAAPDLGRAVRDAGHAIGNHTWSHQEAPADPADEVHRADATIQSVYGGPTAIFRPPYGNFDNGVVNVALDDNDGVILWSVDPNDWDMPGTDVIVDNVLAGVTPGGIVLMHDGGGDRSQTIAALPRIIAGLRTKGYRFVTVPELLAIGAGEVPPTSTGGTGDVTPPVLTVVNPTNSYTFHSLTATGTVADESSGVASVAATLKRYGDGLYWNGTNWVDAPSPFEAQLSANNWSVPFTLSDGHYSVAVSASDKAGNSSGVIVREFRIDNVAPTTTITSPTAASILSSLPTAMGTAIDINGGIRQVSTALARVSDGFWWNGTAWTSTYAEIKATVSGSNWSLTMPAMSNGNYTLYARGIDFVGNVSPWSTASFTINSATAAKTVVSTPKS